MLWPLALCVIAALAPAPGDAQSGRYVIGCPARCDKSMCPRQPTDCPTGQAPDVCRCCTVCASGEGEACGGGGKLGDPVCGEGLECTVPGGGGGGAPYSVTVRRRSKSGVCVCKASEPVCGSDGVSYRNICELKRVSRRAQKLQQPPVLFIQRGACGKGKGTRALTDPPTTTTPSGVDDCIVNVLMRGDENFVYPVETSAVARGEPTLNPP